MHEFPEWWRRAIDVLQRFRWILGASRPSELPQWLWKSQSSTNLHCHHPNTHFNMAPGHHTGKAARQQIWASLNKEQNKWISMKCQNVLRCPNCWMVSYSQNLLIILSMQCDSSLLQHVSLKDHVHSFLPSKRPPHSILKDGIMTCTTCVELM